MIKKSILSLLLVAAFAASLTVSSVSPVAAVSYRTVYLVADNRSRTVTINFSDTAPNDSVCPDATNVGSIQMTYVASSTSYRVTALRVYNSNTMRREMTPEYIGWRINSNTVQEGPPLLNPSTIYPANWATLSAGSNFFNRNIAYGGNMYLDIAKPGGPFCYSQWNATFFKL